LGKVRYRSKGKDETGGPYRGNWNREISEKDKEGSSVQAKEQQRERKR